MELRGNSPFHFIWAIKNGLVVKVWNVGVHGRPKLKMKSLQDIYAIEVQKTFASTPLKLDDLKVELPFDADGVKYKSDCIPVVNQKTIAKDEQTYVYNDRGDGDSDDFNSFNMTLKQIKDVYGSRKRKLSMFLNINGENGDTSYSANQEQLDDGDLDLDMPLVKLKSKHATDFKRKKCKTSGGAVSVVEVSVPNEVEICGPIEVDLDNGNGLLASNIDVKLEVSCPEGTDSSNMICYASDSSVQCNNLVSSISNSDGMFEATNGCDSEPGDPMSSGKVQNCINTEGFFEYSDNIEPIPSNNGDDNREIVSEVISESTGQVFPQLLVVEQKENCILNEVSSEYVHQDSSDTCGQLSILPASEIQKRRNFNHPLFDDTQSPTSINDVALIRTSGIKDFDANNKLTPLPLTSSPSRVHCAPERLLSTRKSISPASQKSLMQDVKFSGLVGDAKKDKSKVRLQFGETPPEKVASLALSDSHFKGILKLTPKSCTLPSPGLLSPLQICSQSAIAFSQRQMQDIESVAERLTTQVKSMKDILEKNLHPQTLPTSQCGQDEVRAAIENATRAEKASKKWMTIMTRDCTRFCKIMEVTEDEDGVGCDNIVGKVRKKITFADEVGRVLCDVKMFNGETNGL